MKVTSQTRRQPLYAIPGNEQASIIPKKTHTNSIQYLDSRGSQTASQYMKIAEIWLIAINNHRNNGYSKQNNQYILNGINNHSINSYGK